MPEESQDPANTQMFRAFVERGEQETPTGRWVAPLVLLVLLVVAAVVVLSLAVG
jgi:hypothetical protein